MVNAYKIKTRSKLLALLNKLKEFHAGVTKEAFKIINREVSHKQDDEKLTYLQGKADALKMVIVEVEHVLEITAW